MGIIAGALFSFALFFAGAALTHFIEIKFFPDPEPGPASKIKFKEDIKINHTDKWLYCAAPVTAFAGTAMAAAIIPLNENLIGSDVNIGLFYFIVVVDFVVLGISIGGWGANSSNSVETYYRIIAQLIAYVVPLGLAIIGPIMMARSMSAQSIIDSQSSLWFIVSQPLGFALYIITALMQVYRSPFLEPFADNNKKGILSFYGGWKGFLWRISLSGVFFVVAAMGAVIFLGGWQGPLLPGFVWMTIKIIFMILLMLFTGRKLKKMSTARMLEISWKYLIPIGLINVLIVGGLILLGVGGK